MLVLMLDSFDAQKARLNENVGYALKSVMHLAGAQELSGSSGECSSMLMLQD